MNTASIFNLRSWSLRLLASFLFIALSHSSFAQTESPHLTFKGVPVDGTLNEFVTKMKAKGFTGFVNKDGTASLYGDFAGYKRCHVYVSTLQGKDLVCKIGVLFPECPTWDTLEGNYMQLKRMLTTKYGEPSTMKEEFQHPDWADDDNAKMLELNMDRCSYSTMFSTDKGDIRLTLVSGDFGSGHVFLSYHDKINGIEVEAVAMEDL